MERFIIQNQDTQQFLGRGIWWHDIKNATLYLSFRSAERSAEKSKVLWKDNTLARIIPVEITIMIKD